MRIAGENLRLSYMGVTPGGKFDIDGDIARQWLASAGNPNGRQNSEVVRPYYNGIDVTRRVRDRWIVDFGINASLEEAAQYWQPFEHVKRVVQPERRKNKRAAYRERWWLHAEPRPAMRMALSGLERYIGTSLVAKHLIFDWIPAAVLPANLLIVIARDDDYFMGALHSLAHRVWARRTGTQLREAESGSRYTPSTTFETFPFPWAPGHEPQHDPRVQAIAGAARELVAKRGAWLNADGLSEIERKKRTLTNLYNERPTWLDLAHKKLDAAVMDAYGWPHDFSDEEILARLLALNQERAKLQ